MSFRVAVALVVLACEVSVAQSSGDPHFSDAAASLFTQSAFAHGYIHGYEDGFHAADQDLQFGRLSRGVHARARSHPENLIPSQNPASLRKGYSQGFVAGYADGAAGSEFRAISEMREAAAVLGTELPNNDAPGSGMAMAANFNRGFEDGYFAGQAYAGKPRAPLGDFAYLTSFCMGHLYGPTADDKRLGDPQKAACRGYATGFRIGYSDIRSREANTRASAK
ncbi:MAG: hypothetical protein JO041_13175 [Acidobacteria bacterium]|nr:hypothetical protein [Acidobacteriota bacterium]